MQLAPSWRVPHRITSGRIVTWKAFIISILVVEAVALGAWLVLDEDDQGSATAPTVTHEGPRSGTHGESSPASAPTNRYHTNVLAGYSFIPPSGWEVKDNGTMSTVTSPDGDAIVALGPAFSGSVQTSSEKLLTQLRQSYRGVHVDTSRVTTLEGRRAIVSEGSALNESGTEIHFGIYTIEGQPHNYAIGLFEGASRSSRESGTLGERIFRSFTFGV